MPFRQMKPALRGDHPDYAPKSNKEMGMLTKRNYISRMLAIASLMCTIAMSAAFGADDLQPLAKQNRNQDPLFLAITNGTTNYLAVVNTRTKEIDYVPTGGRGGAGGNAGSVAV